MIHGGNATIYVSNMDRAVQFYTGTLGLKLENRYGDDWASVDAGGGLKIGLHPVRFHKGDAAKRRPEDSIEIGFQVEKPLEEVVAELKRRGVELHDIPEDPKAAIRLVRFQDPDGNGLYLFAPASW
jgi:catechol 2,3-dioxygenase-like lactoylglutathione lyase family enzyme